MNIQNWSFFVRFLLTSGVLLVYAFFLIRRQWEEVSMPLDQYTRLRWFIFSMLWVTTITLIPSIPYQLQIALGHEHVFWRNVVSVSGGVNLVATTALMVLIFTYKVKKR